MKPNKIKEKTLTEILKYFYTITNLKVSIYDTDAQIIVEYPLNNCAFCKYINSFQEGKKQCIANNISAFEIVKTIKKPYIYSCHMGVIEVVYPLIRHEKVIGYVMFGQIRNNKNFDNIISSIRVTDFDFDPNVAINLLDSIRYHSNQTIKAEMKILEICCMYILTQDMIEYKETLIDRIIDYIENADLKTLKIDTMCKDLGVSRTLIYSTFSNYKNIGIAEYIRDLKIKKAIELLRNGKHSIKEIAYLTGFTDSNHFIKVFRFYTGLTPKQYQKQI